MDAPHRTGSARPAARHTIIGRERELAGLATFMAAPWPRIGLLEGTAGIGKSTLVDAAIALAADGGATTLVARPAFAERDLPYAALSSLLPDALVDGVLPAIAPPRRRALEIALRRTQQDGRELDPAALGLAVIDTVRAIARWGPVLLVIDDLQWCDTPTASTVAFALRRADSVPVALLAGIRSGVASAAVDAIVAARPIDDADRILVGSLSLGAIGRLLESRTGRAWGRGLTARIADAAGGNPLLAIELARAIDASGRVPDPWEPIAVPPSAEPLLADRLALLPDAAGEAVLAVALAGAPTESLLRTAMGEAVAGTGLDAAVRAGLLEVDGTVIRLGHPLVGAAAVGRTTVDRRRATHTRLATATSEPEARARHLALAAPGPDASAADACDAAADDAEHRGAAGTAAELAELAVSLTEPSDGHRTAARRRRAAALRVALGDAIGAREHIEAGLAASDDPQARGSLLLVGVELAHLVGGRPAARRAAEVALEAAGEDPILRARAHAAMLSWGAEDTREERRHAAAVLALLDGREEDAPEAAADALAILADSRLAAGEGPAFDLLDRALELDRMRPDFVVGSLEVLAGNLRTADRLDAARDCWGESLTRLERAGYESRRVSTLTQLAWTEFLAGDHRACLPLLEAAGQLATDLGTDMTGPRLYRAHLDAVCGDRAAVRVAADAGLAEALAAGNTWVVALWERALGIDALAAGEDESAADHLRRTLEAALDLGITEPNWVRVDADLVEALVGAGRMTEAEAALADFGARVAGARLPWAVVAHARATAVLLAARNDLEGSLTVMEPVAALAAGLPLAMERARFDLVRGIALRRLRRVREARGTLEAALAVFAACPSPPWESRAQAELARLGGRASTSGSLTPAERQVAELAAAGRSNREIADELVVSVRTVESQLSAVYGKLGVRGRSALARAMDEIRSPHA